MSDLLKVQIISIISLIFFTAAQVFSSPSKLSFQARIIKPNGKPLISSGVSFRFTVTDHLGTCVIYQEDHNSVNMADSNGNVTISVGAGTQSYPSTALTLTEVFDNNNTGYNCKSGGTYFSGATDSRKLAVQFNDGSGWQTISGMDVNSVPFAMQSSSALKLGAYDASEYLRTSTLPSCVGGQALHYNGGSFTCVTASGGGGGSGTVTSVSSTNPFVSVATSTTTPVITIARASGTQDGFLASSDYSSFNSKLGTTTAHSGDVTGTYNNLVLNNVVTAGTSTKVTFDAKGRIVSSSSLNSSDITTALGYTPVSAAGSGSVTQVSSTNPFVSVATSTTTPVITIAQASSTQDGFLSSTDWSIFNTKLGTSSSFSGDVTGTYNNLVLNNTGVTSGTYTKVSVDAKGRVISSSSLNSSDITSALGYTPVSAAGTGSVTQVSSTNPFVSVATSTTTPVITIAQASSTQDGFLSSTDWSIFNSKQDALGFTPANVASAVLVTTNHSGDVTGTYNNLVLNNTGVTSGTYTKVSVDSKGRVTASSSLNSSDITSALGYTPVSSTNAGTVTQVSSTNPFVSIATSTTTPVITIAQASSTQDGFLASSDWSIFNTKLGTATSFSGDVTGTYTNLILNNVVTSGTATKVTFDTKGRIISSSSLNSSDITSALGYTPVSSTNAGTVTQVSSTNPFVSIATSTTTPVITIAQASSTQDGFLASSDWSVFNSKQNALGFTPASAGQLANYLPLTGGSLSGNLNLQNNKLLNVKNVAGTSLDPTASEDGKTLRWNNTSGQWEWFTAGAAGAGIASINGASGTAQTLQAGSSGSDFTIDTSGSIHTFNIPTATSSARGLLSSGDWSIFSAKLGTATSFSGDVTGTYNNLVLNNVVTSGTATKVTFDTKGRIISSTSLNSSDITSALGYAPVSSTNAGTVTQVSSTNPFVSVATSTTTPVITIAQASSTQDGFLASTDWSIFNSKQDALGFTPVNVASAVLNGGQTGAVSVGSTNANSVVLMSNNQNRLTILASGDVGIGTSTPTSKLEVIGQIAALSASGGWGITLQPNGDAGGIKVGNTTAIAFSGSRVSTINGSNGGVLSFATGHSNFSTGNLGVGIALPERALHTSGTIRIEATSLPSSPESGDISIDISDSNKLKWYNGSSWQSAGGSGTVSQVSSTNPFVSVATSTTTPVITIAKASSTQDGFLASTDWSIFNSKQDALGFTPVNVASAVLNGGQTGAVTIGSSNSSDLTFVTANSARMTILPTGNVGIGTTSATRRLQVNDSPDRFQLNLNTPGLWSASQYTGLSFGSSNIEKAAIIFRESDAYNSWGRGDIIFAVDSAGDAGPVAVSDERMRITTDGNVGVATSSPERLLHVAGPIRIEATSLPSSPESGDIAIDSSDSNKLKWYNGSSWQSASGGGGSSGTVTQVSSTNPFVSVATSTTTPVITIAKASSTQDGFLSSTDWTTFNSKQNALGFTPVNVASAVLNGGQTGAVSLGSSNANNVSVLTNNSARITVLASGDVGIGTATPVNKLDVAGNQYVMGNIGVGIASAPVNSIDIRSPLPAISLFDSDAVVSAGNPAWRIRTQDNGTFRIQTAADFTNYVDRVTITSSGNFGIGTATPSQMLSVSGTIESTTGGFRFPDGTVQTTATGGGSGGTMISGAPDWIRCHHTDGRITLYRLINKWSDGHYWYGSAGENLTYNATTRAFGAGYSGGADYDCAINAWSLDDLYANGRAFNMVGGGSNLWTASASNTFFSGGNVGIGTVSPERLLHVAGSIRLEAGSLPSSPESGDIAIDSSDSNKLKWYNGSSWQSASGGGGGTSGTVTQVSSTNPFVSIATSTTTPVITIARASSTQDGFLASADWSIFNAKLGTSTVHSGDVTGTYNNLVLNNVVTSGTATKVTFDTKGRIISSSSLGSSDVSSALGYTPSNVASSVLNGGQTGAVSLGSTNANSVSVLTNNSARITVLASGDVGIGTATPSTKLDVSGALAVADGSASAPAITFSSNLNSGIYRISSNRFGFVASGVLESAVETGSGMYLTGNSALKWSSVAGGLSGPDVWLKRSAANTLRLSSEGSTSAAHFIVNGSMAVGTGITSETLTVSGTIHTTTGGIKFPDGTIQTTSAYSAANNSMLSGFPDYIYCSGSTGGTWMSMGWKTAAGSVTYSVATGYNSNIPTLTYNSSGAQTGYSDGSGAWTGWLESCSGKSISQLTTDGVVYHIAKGPASQWLSGAASSAYYNAGKVGIGLSAPTGVLHIKAGTTSANTAPIKLTSGSLMSSPEAGAIEYDGTSLYFTDNSNIRRNLASSSVSGSLTSITDIINAAGNINLSPTSASGRVNITATTASTNPSTGALVVSGGVGVAGAVNVTGAIGTSSTMTATGNITTAGKYIAPLGTSIDPTYTFSGDLNTGVFSPTADTLGITTSGIERVRVTSGGFVGIGTANPNTKLHVAGGRIQVDNSQAIQFPNASGTFTDGTAGTRFLNWTDNNFYFDNYSGDIILRRNSYAESMRVTSGGNVGIGSTNPTNNKLEVMGGSVLLASATGSINLNMSKANAGSTSSIIMQNNYSGRAEIGLTGDDNFHFKVSPNGSSWTDAIVIASSTGNVGIGSSSPNNKLEVNGSSALFTNGSGSFNMTISKNNASSTASWIMQNNYSGRAEIGLTGDDNFHFKVSSNGSSWTDAIVIASSTGRVGIGNSNPNYGLDARTVSSAMGPAFSAYMSANTTTAAQNTYAKLVFDSEEFDTDNYFDTTNRRFLPTKAGYYKINLHINISQTGTGAFTNALAIYKNGTVFKRTYKLINYSAGFNETMEINTIVYLNGSTDYIEGFFNTNSTNMVTAFSGASESWMSGTFLRSQ